MLLYMLPFPISYTHNTNITMRLPRLVTWDIDGTLLQARGQGGNLAHKQSLERAIYQHHSIHTSVNTVPHAGSTDIAITRALLDKHKLPTTTIPAILCTASDLITSSLSKADLSHLVLPGVPSVLHTLQEQGVRQGLVTGNMRAAAVAKTSAAGIAHYFEGGAYGCERENRAHILKLAVDRMQVDPAQVVHIGDAVQDVIAAKEVGVKAVGVVTGAFEKEDLEKAGADIVLKDLDDVNAFLNAVQV